MLLCFLCHCRNRVEVWLLCYICFIVIIVCVLAFMIVKMFSFAKRKSFHFLPIYSLHFLIVWPNSKTPSFTSFETPNPKSYFACWVLWGRLHFMLAILFEPWVMTHDALLLKKYLYIDLSTLHIFETLPQFLITWTNAVIGFLKPLFLLSILLVFRDSNFSQTFIMPHNKSKDKWWNQNISYFI